MKPDYEIYIINIENFRIESDIKIVELCSSYCKLEFLMGEKFLIAMSS